MNPDTATATVLFVESGLTGGGSFESLYQLLTALDRSRFRPAVFFLNETKYLKKIQAMGIECLVARDPLYDRQRAERHPRALALAGRALVAAESALPGLSPRLESLVHARPSAALRAFAERVGAHLLHTNNQVNRDLYAIDCARRLGLPCVCHLRSFFSLGFNRGKVRFVNDHAARFVAYSSAVARHWVERGLDPGRVEVIPNAIGPLSVEPADLHAAYGIPVGRKVAGIVGKVIPVRGHEFLLRAFGRMVKEGCDAHLLVVGPGDPAALDALRGLAARLGVADRLTLAGQHPDAKTVIAALDVLALPYAIEPFGRVLLEAWELKTPVVLTRIGDIAELAADGVEALMVEPGDENGLAEAMARILDDQALAENLTQAGRRRCRRDYFIDAQARRLEAVYASVLDGVRGA